VFLGPVLKDHFKVRTNLIGLFQNFNCSFIKIELNTIASDHQIEYKRFIFGLIIRTADNVSYRLGVIRDEFIFDVPGSLFDHVGEEYYLDLIQEEYFADCF
jgi:hypothetical protein